MPPPRKNAVSRALALRADKPPRNLRISISDSGAGRSGFARTAGGTEAKRSSIEAAPIAASICSRSESEVGRNFKGFSPVLFLADVLGVGIGRHQPRDVLVGRELDLDQPAVAERIVVDDPGLADGGLVDLDDLP